MQIPYSRIPVPLTYLNVASYTTERGHVNNYSATPRPHNCISLFLTGGAVFRSDGRDVTVSAGELVFVPWQSLYVSKFFGDPDTKYVTIHCNFAPSGFLFRSADYKLQKLSDGLDGLKEDFLFLYEHVRDSDYTALAVMERLYAALGRILPRLTPVEKTSHDDAILRAIDYMEEHYGEDTPCSELARHVAMSESRFYLLFRRETGITPVMYKNHIRIRHAINLLYGDASVEEITTRVGFNSAAYFRKVFRASTGMNPLEYKKKLQSADIDTAKRENFSFSKE